MRLGLGGLWVGSVRPRARRHLSVKPLLRVGRRPRGGTSTDEIALLLIVGRRVAARAKRLASPRAGRGGTMAAAAYHPDLECAALAALTRAASAATLCCGFERGSNQKAPSPAEGRGFPKKRLFRRTFKASDCPPRTLRHRRAASCGYLSRCTSCGRRGSTRS